LVQASPAAGERAAGIPLQVVISPRGQQEGGRFGAKGRVIARRIPQRLLPCLAAALALAVTPTDPAAAHVAHTVQPGETLWSIAAASNLTTRALAAANGVPETANVILGQTIWIPSEAEAAAALAGGPAVGGQSQAPAPIGGISHASPKPTNELVSPALVQQTAAEHGVSPSLAAAIAKMESGFSNGLVSSANARGVMQILPQTWSFIDSQLATNPLNPASAADNVHAGVLYLQRLLRDTGGDEAAATAAYYQGLSSLRRDGLLPTTHSYVDDVMALRSQFGGP
jgi:soluble lytic murein transglycosylase-like protein